MEERDTIRIIDRTDTIETLLAPLQRELGGDYAGYRGHIYRVLTYAMHFLAGDEAYRLAIETALVYHDIGLWTDHELAYLEPSIERALAANEENRLGLDPELLLNLIYWHQRVCSYRGRDADAVNALRKADWVDATGGLVRHGLKYRQIAAVTAAIPEHGFQQTLQRLVGARKPKGPGRTCETSTNGDGVQRAAGRSLHRSALGRAKE